MKKVSKMALYALLIGSTLFATTSCSDDDDNDNPTPPSLYTRLGGTTMVADPKNPGQMIEQGRLSYRSVVDSTIVLIVGDILTSAPGNLGQHFGPIVGEVSVGNTTNVAVLSKNLTDFFSANTGGGSTNTYSGLDMVSAHDPAINSRMGVKSTNADYDKFIGYVGAAAGLNGVTDTALITDVVAVLESLRDPIVQAP
ncbi:hypothetical protein [Flavobacterium aquatile]|uniref:Group 1 truncated hemoglobin n=1 Tax=Flavobacterium aquatile LMG 4008 = ATCC 11947 TaxID=1453498 RepID=A0A095SSU3_9FLAO|nr:hypothetical protein [Flavobacterium aquatile]KGD67434.1 hypothetical protein LG45_14615 [Flavobacterium aquatile LMG 4008 = ATCC 11947]OXA66971.1 hypothetical protein B0A61_09505 [Flavobacterium aquatile LMG 4008 = ATCC 11947]GEC78776.1 hypothetical protein FAQ01_16460 [Flavobacterium aquatile]